MRILVLSLTLVATTVWATDVRLDRRSWEQVTAGFVPHQGPPAATGVYDGLGGADGRRLKELDAKRAAAFLIPFLAKNQPHGLRIRAISALGNSSFHEAIPALSAIALDSTENDEIRAIALNPGLRYMQHPEAVKTASALAADKSFGIRSGACWVLSGNGTDAAIEVLAARLRANDRDLLEPLIYAVTFSKHPRAGKIVFDSVDFKGLHNELRYRAYAIAMEQYRGAEAQQNMLILALNPRKELSAYYALRYFSAFPRQDVVPALIERVEANKSGENLYNTVTAFMNSQEITEESKKTLSAFITSGKVKK